MKTSLLLLAGTLAAGLSACSRETDADYLRRLETKQLQGCITEVSGKVKALPADAVKSICTCSFDRLIGHYPMKQLREIEENKDKAEAERILKPIMKECIEAEVAKGLVLR